MPAAARARSSWKPTPPKSSPPPAQRVGDPGNGRSRTMSYKFDPEHIAALDALAAKRGTTRPDEMRAAVASVLTGGWTFTQPSGRADARGFKAVTWAPAAGQWAALHELAEELGVSVVSVVRWAVARHIEQ